MKLKISPIRSIPGSPLHLALPELCLDQFNPFLVLHERSCADVRLGHAVGIDDHLNRGYEIINYVVAGEYCDRVPPEQKRLPEADAERAMNARER